MSAHEEELRAAFLAGFGASAEGWNGEYPEEWTSHRAGRLEAQFQDWLLEQVGQ